LVNFNSIRKAISTIVRILTRKSIPVHFASAGNSKTIDGKEIFISSKIHTLDDFYLSMGLGLHEGAHVLLTDFDLLTSIWANVPNSIWKKSSELGIRTRTMESFIHGIWNVIEDRYIDNFIFNEAPGYRFYYTKLYDGYWNSEEISNLLDGDKFRVPSLKSYDFRIMNMTNPKSDSNALPGLKEIFNSIDLNNIERLTTTRDRIDLAFLVTELVLSNIKEHIEDPEDMGGIILQGIPVPGSGESSEESIESDDIKELSEILKQPDKSKDVPPPKENKKSTIGISKSNPKNELTPAEQSAIEKQKDFIFSNVNKDEISEEHKLMFDFIEKNGIYIKMVGANLDEGNPGKIPCIVVKKMTKELVFSGGNIFPLCSSILFNEGKVPEPSDDTLKAVKDGLQLGKALGRKLLIRNEITIEQQIHKKRGTINKRGLHTISFDAEDIFKQINTTLHSQSNLHITVDASSSMQGKKWNQTMKMLVAICKACSYVSNIHVTVSFRSTQMTSAGVNLPYIVLAYDSKKDKINKIKDLFPHLSPNGCTPEGLAYEAIQELFEHASPDEVKRYLLNISDGEPYFVFTTLDKTRLTYKDKVAVHHTKDQIKKIRRGGTKILSYFISSTENTISSRIIAKTKDSCETNFKCMYGKDAKFIDVENACELAKTMNGLFLESDPQLA